MTRQEVIERLKSIKSLVDKNDDVMALREAIKALEQEPCEDAISRQAAIDGLVSIAKAKAKSDAQKSLMGRVMFFTERLPSVNPQPKTGHWIMPVQDDGMSDPIYYQVRCSKCGFDLDPQTWHMELHQYGADKYCPKCGAKMVEPQESEVEE